MIDVAAMLAGVFLGFSAGYVFGWGTHSAGTPKEEVDRLVAEGVDRAVREIAWRQFHEHDRPQFENAWKAWHGET